FLALGMLSLVEECLELIWQTRGEKVDLGTIAYDDPAVYDAICRGDTVGLFQVESRAQIQMLTRSQPRTLDDLAVQVAIVRPGPIVGGAVNPYVRRREMVRRNPRYEPRADHPLIDGLLRDTLGVILYQDQVLEVAVRVGGFTAGEADQFRRAMSRRRSLAAMERFRLRFLDGAHQRGVPRRVAERIFDKLLAFSEFGFPKSHAYAFAVLAYQSAWLRYSYPAEYYAALIDNQPMGFYPVHVLVNDAKRHGIAVQRVSINRSAVRCTPGAGQLLPGLTTVRGLGERLAQALVAEREAHGPFRSLGDLLRRTGIPYAVAESLIAVGALSAFGLGRRELLWQLGLLLPQSAAAPAAAGTPRGPACRPRQLALALPTEQDMVRLGDMSAWERVVADYRILGLSPSFHPLGLLRDDLPPAILPAAALRSVPDGHAVRTAGLVVCRQRPGTAKGFLFLLLEDETGLTNVVVRPDLYQAHRSVVRAAPYLLVEGLVRQRSGTLNLLARTVAPLAGVPQSLLPRPPLRHPYPGHAHDVPAAAAQPTEPAPPPALPHRVAPASHDFR
ncbi:MAG: helix-hairpin-helix domain-containing protein, partial [Chloroflexi bacterium]|nr:helix-hairpin-helix domain-containing protein [Chloroflexota bacterium]